LRQPDGFMGLNGKRLIETVSSLLFLLPQMSVTAMHRCHRRHPIARRRSTL